MTGTVEESQCHDTMRAFPSWICAEEDLAEAPETRAPPLRTPMACAADGKE